MRNYENIDKYLDELAGDVYAQPSDSWHTQMATEVFNNWIRDLGIWGMVDVGCGAEAIMEPLANSAEIPYLGISLGSDVITAQYMGRRVVNMDMSFLALADNECELIWARHVLEHSPMPLLTLMEWHRVSSKYLCVITPNPEHFTYVGRNHYSVMTSHQMVWLLRRAGWALIKYELLNEEFRFLCEKRTRVSYEGYVTAPLSEAVHKFEHDEFLGGR